VSVKNSKKKAATTFPATVEKVIKPLPGSSEPEKAQIAIAGADDLYRELRVPNKLIDEDGNKVKLKQGTEVEVKIESDGTQTESAASSD
jgi:predicted DNA-binding antitoxin AbrB/MazE fold protein